MNHYCTYFDRGFLIQGLAMARSLMAHDRDSVLWVLALDDATAQSLHDVGGSWIRVVRLADVEANDTELAIAKSNRTRIEYFFTLSPCWPRWLLGRRPEIGRLTYLDADLFFFGDPASIFDAMERHGASVLATAHRFPRWLSHYERHGKLNVGILSFRRDERGLRCLDRWRNQCLAWCYDRLDEGKYADQGYLDGWPGELGAALLVLDHPGVNLAPWNWMGHVIRPSQSSAGSESREPSKGSRLEVDRQPLIVFHFARFRPILGTWWWQSGQLDYGVMPSRLRDALYGAYWLALVRAREELRTRDHRIDFVHRPLRLGRGFFRSLFLRAVFGSDWLRVGGSFYSARFGIGRWSGQVLSIARGLRGRLVR